jgi:TolB-like protein
LTAAAVRSARPQAATSQRHALAGKLAVLELRNFAKDLTHENAQYFTDVVRSAALTAQPQLQVMTRENLLVLLQASGKDLANCEGECEVDTGRRIGADQIVRGELQKVGARYKLTLRLHDTREGRLLSSTQASGKTIEELDDAAQKAAADLLSGR